MTERKQPIQWRAVMQGIAIVYGVTFVSGLLLAFNGITPQTNHVAFPILALLTGAVGVAIALRVAETTQLSYLVALSLGVWLLNSTSVLLGAQTVAAWLDSSLFIGTTVILGRLLLGRDLETLPTSDLSHSQIISKNNSQVGTHHGVRSTL
ncbi:MAG: hypothetical protein HZB34_15805 [Nitrospirae bacterium]|jgi:hypothetical protein|nr:hypothetical protein [Nitrospirota bacterium]